MAKSYLLWNASSLCLKPLVNIQIFTCISSVVKTFYTQKTWRQIRIPKISQYQRKFHQQLRCSSWLSISTNGKQNHYAPKYLRSRYGKGRGQERKGRSLMQRNGDALIRHGVSANTYPIPISRSSYRTRWYGLASKDAASYYARNTASSVSSFPRNRSFRARERTTSAVVDYRR